MCPATVQVRWAGRSERWDQVPILVQDLSLILRQPKAVPGCSNLCRGGAGNEVMQGNEKGFWLPRSGAATAPCSVGHTNLPIPVQVRSGL